MKWGERRYSLGVWENNFSLVKIGHPYIFVMVRLLHNYDVSTINYLSIVLFKFDEVGIGFIILGLKHS